MSNTPQTEAMFNSDFIANHAVCPASIYVPAEFARGLEWELSSCRKSQELLQRNYTELYNAVLGLGDGCTTSDFPDAATVAREHREENERMKREISQLKQKPG